MMEFGWNRTAEIRQPLKRFQKDFQVFLAARDASSEATAFHTMLELWQVLGKLPVYNKLMVEGHRLPSLIPYLRKHPDLLDEMLTPGTPRNEGYTRWMGKLERLEDELQAFVKNTQWMLDEFFQNLSSRKRQDYIRAYARYRDAMEDAIQEKEDMEDEGEVWEDPSVDLDMLSFTFPVNISLVPVMDPKTRRPTLAEQMTFESLPGFCTWTCTKGWPPEICPGAALTAAGGFWRWADTIPATATGWCLAPTERPAGRWAPMSGRRKSRRRKRLSESTTGPTTA